MQSISGVETHGGLTISFRKRDGSTLTYVFDGLNRVITKIVPPRTGLTAAQTRDVFYDYDLKGLMTKARFDSLSGEGVTNAYDGFGELTSSTTGSSAFFSHEHDKHGRRQPDADLSMEPCRKTNAGDAS